MDEIENNPFLVITDIDDFKKINDNGGHQVCDDCLAKFANEMVKAFYRKSVYRYG